MKTLNLVIFGHGRMMLDENQDPDMFEESNVNIFTWAPPLASCWYPPEYQKPLIDELLTRNRNITSFKTFYENIQDAEIEIRGINSCSKEWNSFFGETHGYDASKGCGIQTNNIQNKLYNFAPEEDDPFSPCHYGVWDLKTGKNLVEAIGFPDYNDTGYYLLSDIIYVLREVFSDDFEINILDGTCSVIYHEETGELYFDPELQQKIQANIKTPNEYFGGKKSKKRKRHSKMKSRRRRTNKKYYK
jgi:hypothetical protein